MQHGQAFRVGEVMCLAALGFATTRARADAPAFRLAWRRFTGRARDEPFRETPHSAKLLAAASISNTETAFGTLRALATSETKDRTSTRKPGKVHIDCAWLPHSTTAQHGAVLRELEPGAGGV